MEGNLPNRVRQGEAGMMSGHCCVCVLDINRFLYYDGQWVPYRLPYICNHTVSVVQLGVFLMLSLLATNFGICRSS